MLEAETAIAKQRLVEEDLDRAEAYYPKISLKTHEAISTDTLASLLDR